MSGSSSYSLKKTTEKKVDIDSSNASDSQDAPREEMNGSLLIREESKSDSSCSPLEGSTFLNFVSVENDD